MAKHIFYIVLGLLLISKFTSAADDVKGEKWSYAISETECSLSQTDVWAQAGFKSSEKGMLQGGCGGQSYTGNFRNSSSSRYTCSIGSLRTYSSLMIVRILRSLKTLLPEEKDSSSLLYINPSQSSCRYYIYTLRRILI